MATVRLDPPKRFHRKVARLPGVKAAVRAQADRIGAKAEAHLASHRRTGNASIEIGQGSVDSTVSLVDSAAVSIEFGHWNVWTKTHTEGLYIISDAAGLRGR